MARTSILGFVRRTRLPRDDAPVPAETPVAAVREAIAAGESSRSEIAARTGLARPTVDAIIGHLERTGALRREALSGSCATGGCGGCPHASADGGACPSSREPVALVLGDRPPADAAGSWHRIGPGGIT
ncbi:helix-turn-helix domain-containing protein [uncultured Corynebacterium sp.]|uniref:helix-turn-helix domain-containing protein n=1 Tax=uncultured Corynebacterium sp. TaxID=159447 RepID=UPI0025F41A2A|nr:helix-turn-helix domain-containing protein [uncultured Corynebacterium sp.]